MERDSLLKQINEIFIDVLENPTIILKEDTSAADVEEWDSLNHIQLVVAIEKRFKIKFSTPEIQRWKNIGDLCDSVNSKLAGK